MTSAFTINAALSMLLAATIAGLSTLGSAFLHERGVQRVLLVLASIPQIGILEFLPAANLERKAQFQVIAVMTLLRTAASNPGYGFTRVRRLQLREHRLGRNRRSGC